MNNSWLIGLIAWILPGGGHFDAGALAEGH